MPEFPPHPGDAAVVVALWNELAPYRLHFLRRVRAEAPEIRLVNVFTHSAGGTTTMPWQMSIPEGIDIRHDPSCRATFTARIHRGAIRLHRFMMDTIRAERPRLVIMAGHDDAARWMAIPSIRRLGIPLLHHADANIFGEPRPRGIRTALRGLYLRTLLSGFDGVMPSGTCGRAYYHSHVPREVPEFLFPLEPDYGALAHPDPGAVVAFARRHGLGPGRRRFLCSGRLVRAKRVDVAIDAFIRVADVLPQWDLVLAGTGPLAEELRARVPEALTARIRFLGFLQSDELRACYHACDALVHAAAYEPWGLIINEAVATGMAVIATRVTGAANDLVRHGTNGMLVAPGSVDAMAVAMRSVGDAEVLSQWRGRAGTVLADWRAAADPVAGLRAAVNHFSRSGATPASA